jgi:hypothetical protein
MGIAIARNASSDSGNFDAFLAAIEICLLSA